MVTERDSFIYHEMLVHPAMNVLRQCRNVLVIGGGDGGAVTEVVKYASVESIVLCEIDPLVVSSCRKFLPHISCGLQDPRVEVVHEDGVSFVKTVGRVFDLVLVDSTDPVGPAKALYEVPFYESVKQVLSEHGAAVFQTESPIYMEETCSSAVTDLAGVFGSGAVYPYFATIPCYPGGLWSFTFCSGRHDPIREAPADQTGSVKGQTRYYDSEIHRAAFAIPVFVRESLGRIRK